MILELKELAIFGRHGVLEEERRDGQEFLYDVRLDVGDAGVSDEIEDAVDYREVADCVREVSDSRNFNLIEALATEVADAAKGKSKLGVEMSTECHQRLQSIGTIERGTQPIVGPP